MELPFLLMGRGWEVHVQCSTGVLGTTHSHGGEKVQAGSSSVGQESHAWVTDNQDPVVRRQVAPPETTCAATGPLGRSPKLLDGTSCQPSRERWFAEDQL